MTSKTIKNFYKHNKLGVIMGAIVLAIILLGVFGDSSDNQSKTSTASTNNDVQTKCLADVNDKTFCKFAGTFAAAGDYSATMTSTTGGVTSNIQVAVAANGNGSMTVRSSDTTSSSIVVYGGTTYVQDPTDNQWLSYALGSPSAPALVDIKKEFAKGDFKNSAGQKDQYLNKGTEVVNGLKSYKYQIVDPAQPGQQGFIWFDTKNYLLRKLSTKDATTDLTMTFTYDKVSIVQPYPIKGPAAQ